MKQFILLLALLYSIVTPLAVHAHGGIDSPTQAFTQAIGPYELTVVAQLPEIVPAPVQLTLIPLRTLGDAILTLRMVPRGAAIREDLPSTQLRSERETPTTFQAQLPVTAAGPWDLVIEASGTNGSGVARIPLTVTIAPWSANVIGLWTALGALVALLVVSMGVTALTERRGGIPPAWLTRTITPLGAVFLTAATIFGGQQWVEQDRRAQQVAGMLPIGQGRPHVNAVVEVLDARAGQLTQLQLRLTDGGTGLPVDDLETHHEAIIHLVVISADSTDFQHLHPARSEAGQFAVNFTPRTAGAYTAYIEIERADSGTQVIPRSFTVGGVPRPSVPPPGLGEQSIDGLRFAVTASNTPTAGTQTVVTLRVTSADESPVTDLEPWLGMGGHMIARSFDGQVFAHVHAAAPMAATGSPARYGPEIRFVYTFPTAGEYRIWLQVRRGEKIFTVPVAISVGS